MTDTSTETLDEKNLRETVEKMNLKFFDWLKSITTIATGLIVVLVSLKSNHQQKTHDNLDNYSSLLTNSFHLQEWSFFLTILSVSLGILFAFVSLYQDVALLRSSAKEYRSRIQAKQRQHMTGLSRPDEMTATGMKQFPLFVRISLRSYFLGLLFLIVYAYCVSGL